MVSSVNSENMIKGAEILEAAADGWESGQYEWVRGAFQMPVERDGCTVMGFCSVGVLMYHYGNREGTQEATRALGKSIIDEIPTHVREDDPLSGAYAFVPFWNDQVATDKADVVDRFKRAAKDLRNEAGVTL